MLLAGWSARALWPGGWDPTGSSREWTGSYFRDSRAPPPAEVGGGDFGLPLLEAAGVEETFEMNYMLFPGGTGGGVHPEGELQVSLLVALEAGFTSGWVMEASLRGLLR